MFAWGLSAHRCEEVLNLRRQEAEALADGGVAGHDGFRVGAAVSGAEVNEHADFCALWPGVAEALDLPLVTYPCAA